MRGKPQGFVLLLSIVIAPAVVQSEVTVRDPGTYVVDRANIIESNAQQRLEAWLRELQLKTTAQVKVLTVPSTEGEDFFGFAQRHAELWKLGQSGKDNGALIVLALQERNVRIQTGYGLEGTLPDSWCGSASREVAAKYFKSGAYSEGLFRLTVSVANRVADQQNVTLTGMPEYRHSAQQHRRRGTPVVGVNPLGMCCGGGFMPLIIMAIVLSSMSRNARHRGRWGGGGGFGGGGGGASW